MKLKAQYYEQFDADLTRDVPAEGFGGWCSMPVEIDPARTALASMHAWRTGTAEQYPGWYRAVEYLPRATEICRTIFPPLFAAVRESPIRIFHIVANGDHDTPHPGHVQTKRLAGPEPEPLERIEPDASLLALRRAHAPLGKHNVYDIQAGMAQLDFAPEAAPAPHEPIAENGHQLFALCKKHGITHLIYAGFAINWCLLLSPGGMADMHARGLMCSALRQAVTAVENRETARTQMCKEVALWRVAVEFGFVFDVDDLMSSLRNDKDRTGS